MLLHELADKIFRDIGIEKKNSVFITFNFLLLSCFSFLLLVLCLCVCVGSSLLLLFCLVFIFYRKETKPKRRDYTG